MNRLVPMLVVADARWAVAFFMPHGARAGSRLGARRARQRWPCSALLALSFADHRRDAAVYHMGGWPTPIGIDLRLDGLTTLMLLAINVIGLAATLFSVQYMGRYTSKRRYYSLFLLMVAGMNGVVLTGDLFNLYVFLEIAAIASYALVAFGCEHEELEASFKYVVLGSVASTLHPDRHRPALRLTGTLNMAHDGRHGWRPRGPTAPVLFALGLFIGGFGLKAALVPFHAWLPDAHPSAPAPDLGHALRRADQGPRRLRPGPPALQRLRRHRRTCCWSLRWLGVVSMVVGRAAGHRAVGHEAPLRLPQHQPDRLRGARPRARARRSGIAGGLFHLLNHSVFKSLLFLNAGAVEYATGTRDLKRLGGLSRRMPVTGATSLVGLAVHRRHPALQRVLEQAASSSWPACRPATTALAVVGGPGQPDHPGLVPEGAALRVLRRAPEALARVRRVPAAHGARPWSCWPCCCWLMSLLVISGLETPVPDRTGGARSSLRGRRVRDARMNVVMRYARHSFMVLLRSSGCLPGLAGRPASTGGPGRQDRRRRRWWRPWWSRWSCARPRRGRPAPLAEPRALGLGRRSTSVGARRTTSSRRTSTWRTGCCTRRCPFVPAS